MTTFEIINQSYKENILTKDDIYNLLLNNKIIYDESKYVGAKSKVLVIDKLKKIIPEFEMLSLNEGLKTTVSWFMKNKDVLVK